MTGILDLPQWKKAFIIYRRLAFLALKQREIEWTRPFLYKCLQEYKHELTVLLEEQLLEYYLKIKKLNEIEARSLRSRFIKYGYFIEEIMSYVQTGSLNITNSWVKNYLVSSYDVEKYFFITAQELYINKLKQYQEDFGDIEGEKNEIIEKYYICNILYNIDVEDLFRRLLILKIYDSNIKFSNMDDSTFSINPIPYPTFLLKNITRAKIDLNTEHQTSQLYSKSLNLSLELYDNVDNLPSILSDYLFEFFRLHDDLKNTLSKDKAKQLGSTKQLAEIIWFIESLVGSNTGIIRPDELLSLIIVLISFDLVRNNFSQEYDESIESLKVELIELRRDFIHKYKKISCYISIWGIESQTHPEDSSTFNVIDNVGSKIFKKFKNNFNLLIGKSKIDSLMHQLYNIAKNDSILKCVYFKDKYVEFEMSINSRNNEKITRAALEKRIKRNISNHAEWMRHS